MNSMKSPTTSHNTQYLGMYPAEVVDVQDPDKRCRVRVNVFDLTDGVPVDSLPWANQTLPLGSRPNEGAINPMQKGDKVWVQFVGGDTRRPIIVGASQDSPSGKVNLSPEGSHGQGRYEHKRTEKQPVVEEPPYYEDVVYQQNNALIQLCRSGTIRITQMTSGSAIELLPSGDMVIHCEGNMFTSVKGNTLQEFDGNVEQIIKGNMTTTVSGSYTIQGATVNIN